MRYLGDRPSELVPSWDKKAKPRDPATLIFCLWQRPVLDTKPEQLHLMSPTLFSLLSLWSGDRGIVSSYSCCHLSLYLQLSSGKSPVTIKTFSYICFSHSNLLLLISQHKTAWTFFLYFSLLTNVQLCSLCPKWTADLLLCSHVPFFTLCPGFSWDRVNFPPSSCYVLHVVWE